MKRTVVLALTIAALIIGLAAPAGASSKSHKKAKKTPKASAFLLTISALPTGWNVDNSTPDNSTTCYSDPVTKVPSLSYAHVDFQQGGSFPALTEELGYFANPKKAFATISSTLNGCMHFTETASGQTVQGTMGQMSSPSYGDQSAAWDATLTVEGETVNQGLVMARKGSFIALVAIGDLGSISDDGLQGFMSQAMGKVPA